MSNEKRAITCATIISLCIIFMFGLTFYSIRSNNVATEQVYAYESK